MRGEAAGLGPGGVAGFGPLWQYLPPTAGVAGRLVPQVADVDRGNGQRGLRYPVASCSTRPSPALPPDRHGRAARLPGAATLVGSGGPGAGDEGSRLENRRAA